MSVRPDKDNPLSQGFMCVKAQGMIDVNNDPDRVRTPLRRVGAPGEFEPVSWDTALQDIASRLLAIIERHGPDAFALFFGNPPGFGSANLIWADGFLRTVGSKWKYSVNGEDAASLMAASYYLFGSPALVPKPDLWRTDLALIMGANPLVSHGSAISEPRIREALDWIVARGGRVIVVDPRRTDTAARYEHVAPIPGSDPWLLIGLLSVIFDEGLEDAAFLATNTSGAFELRRAIENFGLEQCAERCGVSQEVIANLARAISRSERAAVYGRTGTCTQTFGTLANFLQGVLNVVSGNLERPGGAVFGWGLVDLQRLAALAGMAKHGTPTTRVQGLPASLGLLPSQGLIADIVTPGAGQIRSLFTFGANPALSSGAAGSDLDAALEQLDLHFSLDLYMNETNKHAHYILPAPTFFERPDVPLIAMGQMLRPTMFATDAVVPPPPGVKQEWEVLNEIARRMGRGGAYPIAPLRWLAKRGWSMTPSTMYDVLIRLSSHGDLFGLRRNGLSLRKLIDRHPHGVSLRDDLPVKPLKKRLRTSDRRCHLAPPEILEELRRLRVTQSNDEYPLRMFGMRERRTHNSWMHNVERLVPDHRHQAAFVHPDDAAEAGLSDGALAAVESPTGRIEIMISITDSVRRGSVAIPHSWGHNGGWQRANRAGGATSNLLVSSRNVDIERLAGMSALNGVPIRLRRVAAEADRDQLHPIPPTS